jgi:hypothetical protein
MPYKFYRDKSKGTNFGAIFGTTGSSLGERLKNAYGFSEKDCDDVIQALSLQKDLNVLINKDKAKAIERIKRERYDNELKRCIWTESQCEEYHNLNCKYVIVGTAFVEKFFESYKGLKERIKREGEFAKEHHYIQSWRGVQRRLPRLLYMNFGGRSGGVQGADRILWSSKANGDLNIAANTDAQTVEAYFAFTCWPRVDYFLKFNGLKSRIFNGTHDSYDFWLYEGEENLVVSLAQKIASRDFNPMTGIKMAMDAEISDVSTPENRKETYYKAGEEVKEKLIFEDEVKKYEEKNNVKLTIPDWLFVE